MPRSANLQAPVVSPLAPGSDSDDPALVAAWLEQHGFRAFDVGQIGTARVALASVPNHVLALNPSALALKAMVASLDGRFDIADVWFEAALRDAHGDARTEIVVRYGLDLVRRARSDAVPFLSAEIARGSLDEANAAQLWALLATAYIGSHRMDDARRAAQKALRRMHAVENDAVRARIFHQAAFVALNDGDMTSAKDLAQLSLDHAERAQFYDVAARALSVLHNLSVGVEDDPAAARSYLVRMADCARKATNPVLILYSIMNLYELDVDAGNLAGLESLDDELADLRIFLTPMASESLLPAQALRAAWEGRFEHAYSLLSPSAEKQFDEDRRAVRWAEVAAYAAAAGMRAESARAVGKCRAALRKTHASDRSALRAQAFLAIAEILLAHDGRARSVIAGLRAASRGAGRRFAALVEAIRALYARWSDRCDEPFALPDALEGLERVELGGIARFIEALSLPTSPQGRVALLSDLEKAIIRRVAAGETSKEIAADLGRSPQTIDVHVRTICRKFGCSGRRRAVAFAIGSGLIDERRQSPRAPEGHPLARPYPVAGNARIATIPYAS
jgi:DNA-binding CsgD family transcriptional regulator